MNKIILLVTFTCIIMVTFEKMDASARTAVYQVFEGHPEVFSPSYADLLGGPIGSGVGRFPGYNLLLTAKRKNTLVADVAPI